MLNFQHNHLFRSSLTSIQNNIIVYQRLLTKNTFFLANDIYAIPCTIYSSLKVFIASYLFTTNFTLSILCADRSIQFGSSESVSNENSLHIVRLSTKYPRCFHWNDYSVCEKVQSDGKAIQIDKIVLVVVCPILAGIRYMMCTVNYLFLNFVVGGCRRFANWVLADLDIMQIVAECCLLSCFVYKASIWWNGLC